MGANSTFLSLFLGMPMSPLLEQQHLSVQISIRLQPEIKMADVKPDVLVYLTLQMEHMRNFSGIRILCWVEKYGPTSG